MQDDTYDQTKNVHTPSIHQASAPKAILNIEDPSDVENVAEGPYGGDSQNHTGNTTNEDVILRSLHEKDVPHPVTLQSSVWDTNLDTPAALAYSVMAFEPLHGAPQQETRHNKSDHAVLSNSLETKCLPETDLSSGESASLRQFVKQVISSANKEELEQTLLQNPRIINAVLEQNSISLSPLAYAVKTDNQITVLHLLQLQAQVNLVMPDGETALTIAAKNKELDGTDMVRFLLSKGADHRAVPRMCEKSCINITMAYWLHQAEIYPVTQLKKNALRHTGLERLPESFFQVVGERYAVQALFDTVCCQAC